jgi:hypothetical protein
VPHHALGGVAKGAGDGLQSGGASGGQQLPLAKHGGGVSTIADGAAVGAFATALAGGGGAAGHVAPGVSPWVTAYTMPAVDSVNHSGW